MSEHASKEPHGGTDARGARRPADGSDRARPPGGAPRRALLATAVAAAVLAGCGDGEQLPVDAELTVSPRDRTIEIGQTLDAQGRCEFDPNRFVDLPVVVRLRAGNGSPLGDVSVSVYLDWSGNTYPGHPALALYEDRNGNGVIDADSELASGRDDDIARVVTDDETGARAMIVRMNISCPYRGELFAFTGGVTAQSSFEAVALETTETETETAPVPELPADDADDALPPMPDDVPADILPTDVPPADGNPFEPLDGPDAPEPEAPVDPDDAGPDPLPCLGERTSDIPSDCPVPAELA